MSTFARYKASGRVPITVRFFGGSAKPMIIMNVLGFLLIVGCSTGSSPIATTKPHDEKPPIAANNPSSGQSKVDGPSGADNRLKTLDCGNPQEYSVDEVRDSGANYVKIVRDTAVLHSIKLPTAADRNGFGFNWAKKTKEGFEIAIEYGSRFYYEKRFSFVCRKHRFFLNKIRVSSFDKNNPRNSNEKLIRVQPALPLDRFSITDFMLEGAHN